MGSMFKRKKPSKAIIKNGKGMMYRKKQIREEKEVQEARESKTFKADEDVRMQIAKDMGLPWAK